MSLSIFKYKVNIIFLFTKDNMGKRILEFLEDTKILLVLMNEKCFLE